MIWPPPHFWQFWLLLHILLLLPVISFYPSLFLVFFFFLDVSRLSGKWSMMTVRFGHTWHPHFLTRGFISFLLPFAVNNPETIDVCLKSWPSTMSSTGGGRNRGDGVAQKPKPVAKSMSLGYTIPKRPPSFEDFLMALGSSSKNKMVIVLSHFFSLGLSAIEPKLGP